MREVILYYRDANSKDKKWQISDYKAAGLTLQAAKKALTESHGAIETKTVIEVPDDLVTAIIWSEGDFVESLFQGGYPVTPDNILAISKYKNVLQERSVEEGWQIIHDIMCDAVEKNQ